MKVKQLIGILVSSACLAAGVASAQALPPSRTMTYTIYQDRADRQSAVEFVVVLDLIPQQQTGHMVGWAVDVATFERHLGSLMIWTAEQPALDTSDGLWWINHANPSSPVDGEFKVPPHMSGTATPKSGTSGNLDYDFAGATYTPPSPPAEPPFGDKTGLGDFIFLPPEPTPPTGTDDDEEVEIDQRH